MHRAILVVAVLFLVDLAEAKEFGVPRPVPDVVGLAAEQAAALVGEKPTLVTGEKAREACSDTCSEVLAWGGGKTPRSSSTVEAAFLFVDGGVVRSARWVFAGDTAKPASYPRFDELFALPPPEGDLIVVSSESVRTVDGVSDAFVRDLMWTIDGEVWTAMTLSPIVPKKGKQLARRSKPYEYRVVQMKVGGQPLWKTTPRLPKHGWTRENVEQLLGAPAAILSGARIGDHCADCDTVAVWGPASVASAAFSNVSVFAHFKKDVLVGARWVCRPITSDTSFALPRVTDVVSQRPKDDDEAPPPREWTVDGASFKAELDCAFIRMWSAEEGTRAKEASLSHCRVREISWRATGEPPAREPATSVKTRDPAVDVRDFGITPIAVHAPPPVYPGVARMQNVTSVVSLEIVVSRSGRVQEILVLQSDSALFIDPSIEAVSKWRYQPILVNGEAITWKMRINLKFQLR